MFSNYFISEIETIWEGLECYLEYTPTQNSNIFVQQYEFEELSCEYFHNIVSNIKTISSELDLIPITTIKSNLEEFLPVLTKIDRKFY